MKKLTAILLAGAMLTSILTGCGGGSKIADKEDPNKYPEEPYEINWYTQGTDTQADVAAVEAAINEITKKEINATVKLNILGSAQYDKKLQTMVAAGEYFDIAFTSAVVLPYFDTLKSGAFFDMAPYVDEYLSKTKAMFPETFFASAYNEKGQLGAIPINKEHAYQYGWIYNKDIADKYNIDMSKIKTLEELEPVLEMLKEKESSIAYPIEWDSSSLNQNMMSYTMGGAECALFFDQDGNVIDDKAVIFPEGEQFRKLAHTARRYYEKGLVKPDALTAADASARFAQGKAFCIIAALKPGACYEKFPNAAFTVAQEPFSKAYLNAPTGSMLGVSSTSKNPYRVMRFIELLYNNKELSNLVVYGIEGKHYNKISENVVEKIPNSGYDMSTMQWMLGNVFNNYLLKTDMPDKYEQFKKFNEEAVADESYGFLANLDEYELEVVSINGVKAQYRNQALLGTLDPDPIVDEYIAKLKEAGIEKVVAEVNKQFTEFLKNKGK